jgi:hypothetical protein
MKHIGLLIAALFLTLACAARHDPDFETVGPRGDSKTITAGDLKMATQLNLLDYVVAERPHWLRTPDGRPSAVVVYLNGTRLGGPSTLRDITISTVTSVRYYDAPEAHQKFTGVDRGPVIQVIPR